MLKKFSLLFVFALSACGWHFKNNEVLPESLRTLTFESADQHSEMSRILRNQLKLSDVKLVPRADNVAKLRLVSTSSSNRVVSVFKQAREAEKILTLDVEAIADIPNKGQYPLTVSVHRTFFDDSRAALAKSAEKEMIMKDMYEQAARQLIIKMAGLNKELSQVK
ncbi:LPS assembly lipoprotein LptE [Mannheimia sp. AT1]|uniref:LPS-assembly lipoprotein LptE n=1 Tax=Mannheimia cairinae TaxID=3025936 RepID=A0ABT5MLQ7_9PAST|nr:LPS assembly lipoprotein LptE [Mannheimia cairinae]MDD0823055.1 LPS assembly lipoprotein LptE [Mannheimia cairinae]MDD0825920.1 LPS assembly lipoprotein LptE [Mannheimia cairinae]